MKLEIIKIEENKFLAKYGKDNELEIGPNSENWNSEGINKFLIKIATMTPDENVIEISCDQDELTKDNVYKHIVDLFTEFAKEYNNLLQNKLNN